MYMNDSQFKNKISKIWEEEQTYYQISKIKAIIYKADKEYQLGCFLLTFLSENENINNIIEYEKVILFEKSFPKEIGYNIIQSLCQKNSKIIEFDNYKFELNKLRLDLSNLNSSSQGYEYNWNNPSSLLGFDWPRYEIYDNQCLKDIPEPQMELMPLFVKDELPFFSSLENAKKFWLDIKEKRTRYDWEREIGKSLLITMPRYFVKIEKIIFEVNSISIRLFSKVNPFPSNLKCKYEYYRGNQYFREEMNIENKEFQILIENDLNEVLDEVSIVIIDEITSFVYDWYKYRSDHFQEDNKVHFTNDELHYKKFLQKGEGKHVEFKQYLPKNDKEFLETVSAFTNTEGGIIFFGVDDNSGIIGIAEKGFEVKVYDTISNKFDPPIDPEIQRIIYEGQELILVIVKEGDNKPYFIKDKGAYVRRGSTDQLISRSELDEIYRKRTHY